MTKDEFLIIVCQEPVSTLSVRLESYQRNRGFFKRVGMLVDPNFAVKITKACCVLHNFVRRRDGFNFEDSLNCGMDSITERRGVGNSQSNAKDVR